MCGTAIYLEPVQIKFVVKVIGQSSRSQKEKMLLKWSVRPRVTAFPVVNFNFSFSLISIIDTFSLHVVFSL